MPAFHASLAMVLIHSPYVYAEIIVGFFLLRMDTGSSAQVAFRVATLRQSNKYQRNIVNVYEPISKADLQRRTGGW